MPGSIVRLAMAAVGTLVLSLLSTSIAEAGPARRQGVRSERTICGTPSGTRSTASAEVRSFSRKSFFRTRQLVHRHIMAKLQRDQVKRLIDDDEAINSAVSGHDTPVQLGTLEPIGMLAVPTRQPTSHRIVLRRSPRGPPPSPV